MAGVAKLAENMGYEVTGCDLEKGTAYAQGIYKGHSAMHLKGIDLLVVSPAVYYQNPNNAELVEAQKKGIVMTCHDRKTSGRCGSRSLSHGWGDCTGLERQL